MVKPKEQGGFEGARDAEGKVRFSESTLRYYWLNWLVIMDNTHMNICACETCSNTNDVHEAYLVKRRQICAEAESRLNKMDDGTEKDDYKAKLKAYKDQIFDDGNVHKYCTGRDACEQFDCGVKIAIGDDKLPHYSCIANQCDQCDSPRLLRLPCLKESGGMTKNSSHTHVSQPVNDAPCTEASTSTQLPRSLTLGVTSAMSWMMRGVRN